MQYICFAGVNLSLLSKVMSSRLARGTYNGGLLSTEAGTLARVVADGTITLVGYLGESRLLNVTMVPNLLIGLLAIVGTVYTYDSMFWVETWLAYMPRKVIEWIYTTVICRWHKFLPMVKKTDLKDFVDSRSSVKLSETLSIFFEWNKKQTWLGHMTWCFLPSDWPLCENELS